MAATSDTAPAGKPAAIYLASRSPRRRTLLEQIGVAHECLIVDVDERFGEGEAPSDYVMRLATDKARAGWDSPSRKRPEPVLGADTAVVLDGAILGKPADDRQAGAMLASLSGRAHEVFTAVALVRGDTVCTEVSRSRVWLRAVQDWELRAYLATGEARDKAGGYAIQGRAAVFVNRLEGSYSGVMGLPLCETAGLLRRLGIDVLGRA